MTGVEAPGFWRTVWLLLTTARRRSRGRQARQQQMLNSRRPRWAMDWGSIGVIVSLAVMALIHGMAAFTVMMAVESAQVAHVQRQGLMPVRAWFYFEAGPESERPPSDESYRSEAERSAEADGGDEDAIEARLRDLVASSGNRHLIPRDVAAPGLSALARSAPAATLLGSLILIWWFAMMVCQGEGLELDLQRRRHPMWEWLLSHPVGAGAVFFAEMLAPIAANPSYWAAPVFPGILYGVTQGPAVGLVAAVLIGIPLTVAAACLGKALEIGAMLRLPLRSRGAAIGIMGWFGYASMISMFFALRVMPGIAHGVVGWIGDGGWTWPVLRLFLGMDEAGGFSLLRGVAACIGFGAVVIAASVAFSAWSVRQGLSGAFASDSVVVRSGKAGRFGRDPLFRKEYLWFVRDRSALVQVILIPVTVAGVQLVNFHRLIAHAADSWNYLCAAGIFFGTYFLWILGPKSLTSEGSALWIAMTWPRGLEAMLKAKAWLWSMIASALVGLVLLLAGWIFPHQAWKIALLGVAWFLFARTMAEKAVTLVAIVSESGEPQKISRGRVWAAQLGMLTFAIGVVTQQWHLVIVGIVYSWITAAAMWENLRARLPYLYDPWSERLPPPPTLMHAMVAISILIECVAVVTAIGFAVGRTSAVAVQGGGYALCALTVAIGMGVFLNRRGVSPAAIWCWREDPSAGGSWFGRYVARDRRDMAWLAAGIGGGLALALVAHLYTEMVSLLPWAGEAIRTARNRMDAIPGMATTYAVIAILMAPFAEEYLFRGLLFRTLDRQWGGGWLAVLGAAAFFAIYHPLLSWLPVALVGVANCVLFKRSERLTPAILLHMTYNAVVILWV
ncbi:CPBP family intramembrane glutamic endopeptidase [Sphingomonas sp.]|uniref:CPBP family intramembrane glutamic endopeptidase n=1 Tax=Sphingomonas sp. TaxID=28214 RepID=UPI0031DA1403